MRKDGIVSSVVRLIYGSDRLVLDACDGKRIITKGFDIFSSISGFDFTLSTCWDVEVCEATSETSVAVYEVIENADFIGMFTSLNSDVRKLALTQDQILNFVQKYERLLREGGQKTFFLFRAAGQFLIADVYIGSEGGLRVCLYRFGDDRIWKVVDGRRLVVARKSSPLDFLRQTN